MHIYMFDLPALGLFSIFISPRLDVRRNSSQRATGRTHTDSHRDLRCIWKRGGGDGQTTGAAWKEERAGRDPRPCGRAASRGQMCGRLQAAPGALPTWFPLTLVMVFRSAGWETQIHLLPHFLFLFLSSSPDHEEVRHCTCSARRCT